jgi:hypothetical protein
MQIPSGGGQTGLERSILGEQVIECFSVLIPADNDQISLHAPLLMTADIEFAHR